MPGFEFPPPQSNTASPHLWEMDEYAFQEFSREVWERRGVQVIDVDSFHELLGNPVFAHKYPPQR